MDYLYMDNFRGFAKTVLPITDMNFLVGENSTGKSSVMALIQCIQSDYGTEYLAMALNNSPHFGSFTETVSAGSDDKKYFTIGFITKEEAVDQDSLFTFSWTGCFMRFKNQEGGISLDYYFKENSTTRLCLKYSNTRVRYKIESVSSKQDKTEEELIDYFLNLINSDYVSSGFSYMPKDVNPNSSVVHHVFGLERVFHESNKEGAFDRLYDILSTRGIRDTHWLSPIRSSPKKIYDGAKPDFSPEGLHSFFTLNKLTKTHTEAAKQSLNAINNFGKQSGLFDSITTHTFGSTAITAPFEVVVNYGDAEINLNNVGYGVSQSLPIIIDFLTTSSNKVFMIQQPEVHLHPKAQAAFGDFLHELLANTNKRAFVETHSDYMIDRFRLAMSKSEQTLQTQVVYFEKNSAFNKLTPIRIGESGTYPDDMPESYRDFFINEAIELLKV